jgi:hypothetical protein
MYAVYVQYVKQARSKVKVAHPASLIPYSFIIHLLLFTVCWQLAEGHWLYPYAPQGMYTISTALSTSQLIAHTSYKRALAHVNRPIDINVSCNA